MSNTNSSHKNMSKRILHSVAVHGKDVLRERLKQEAVVNAERDMVMATEWFPLEEEAGTASKHRQRKRKTKH
jgi:hypothetical protein